MYINRTLLLLLALALVFIPSAQEWVTSGGTAWYRPYLVWVVIVAAAWWIQRTSLGDDL
ncbi:MAG: hypothetical protein ABJ308_02320 [Halieaceae bacterium]